MRHTQYLLERLGAGLPAKAREIIAKGHPVHPIREIVMRLRLTIDAKHGFTMTVTKVDPGKGSPLHSHKTVEVFVPLSGQWAFYWGDKGENEVTLGPWDVISFPAGLMEGFRNLSDEPGYLLAVLGGPEVGEVTYARQAASA